MKQVWILLLTFLGLLSPAPVITPTPAAIPTQAVSQLKTVNFGDSQYAYSYFKIEKPDELSLIPNFSYPKDAESLMTDNNCTSAINGGFYDKSNRPLGYFESSGKVSASRIQSDLLNGFLWKDATHSAVISTELPRTEFRFAIQTGPMLIFDGKTLPLSIHNDTQARRMLAAKNDELIFITVYNGESQFEGPLLSDLPAIIEAISEKEKLNIMDAINLDGGSASAFYSKDTGLSEFTPVGSLFCQK